MRDSEEAESYTPAGGNAFHNVAGEDQAQRVDRPTDATSVAPKRKGCTLRLGLYTFSLQRVPFDELLDLASESGVEALELGVSGRATTPGFEAETLLQNSERRAEIQESIAGHGMAISALNATSNPLHPNVEMRERYLNGLKAAIRLAAQFGVTRVVTGAGCPGESEQSRHPLGLYFPRATRTYSSGSGSTLRFQSGRKSQPMQTSMVCAFASKSFPEQLPTTRIHSYAFVPS